MKTVQFETTKVHGLFVKLLEQEKLKLIREHMLNSERRVLETNIQAYDLPKGDWQLQGLLTNLTDSQKEAVCKDAYEFDSLLESLKVYSFNHLQDEWDEVCTWGHGSKITHAEYMEVANNTGNWVLLTSSK